MTKFFGHDVLDVGHLTGWPPDNKLEAKFGADLVLRVERDDNGRGWVATFGQFGAEAPVMRLSGDHLGKLVALVEQRVGALFRQLDGLARARLSPLLGPAAAPAVLTARDIEMLRMAASVLDGSHPFDPQTVTTVVADLAKELRAIARAHCPHVRVADGACRHCDAPQDFEAGGRDVPMVGSSPRENVQHPAGLGPTSSPARGDQ